MSAYLGIPRSDSVNIENALGSGRLSMARTILKASNDLAERVGEG